MQTLKNSQLVNNEINELIIPHEKVAHVHKNNPLNHALLVLIKSGYTAIPVLDHENKIQGQISKAQILDSILGLERIEMERLNEYVVEDVADPDIPTLQTDSTFGEALMRSINYPFLCIVDENGAFIGILTRRSILALMHRYFQQT